MKQGIYVASAVQKYPLGMKYARGGRAWYYTKLAATTHLGGLWGPTGYGGISQGLGLFSVAKPSTNLTIVKATKGEATVKISSPTLTVNAYAGGLLTIYEAGQPYCILGIVSNTATVIILDGNLPGTYSAGLNANSYLFPSPYHEVVMSGIGVSAGAPFDYCPGIFNTPLNEDGNDPAAGDFVWLQTWGFCLMWISGTYEGGVGGEREVVVCGEGAAQVLTDANIGTYGSKQHIGVLYPGTGNLAAGHTTDPADGTNPSLAKNIIFLRIAP